MTQSPPTDVYDTVRFDVRIPKARIAVLIGPEGTMKRRLEKETNCKISVDSQEGDVTIDAKDAVLGFVLRDVIKAIGRGFNPDYAIQLLKPDFAFEMIDLGENIKSKNSQQRIKGRVIGKEGKTREIIEKLMEVKVSVFGKTVGIIGEVERVSNAKQAIEMLIDGSPHANVYRWLEKKRKTLVKGELSGSNRAELKEEYKDYA